MGENEQRGQSDAGDPTPEDDGSAGVLRTVGKLVKFLRERAGLTQVQFGEAIGYSEEQVSSVERGRRAAKAQFLNAADDVLGAGGMLAAFIRDVEQAKYPKKVRDVAILEEDAVEVCSYENAFIDGLLQTEEYAKELFAARRPPYPEDELELHVAARMSRQSIIQPGPLPVFSFIQEEVTLRRPIGSAQVMRRQLEWILELASLRHIDIQVLPTERGAHAGLAGSFRLLQMKDGIRVGLNEVQLISRVITDPRDVHILNMRYGMLRGQALTPDESMTFIKKVLGERHEP